ncbi:MULTISPECIES: glycoside hydrolase domain-containing protein [Chitinophagaceae]
MKKIFFCFIASCSFYFSAQSQELKYTNTATPWQYDSLGNHRILVRVSKVGDVAKAVISWRRRDYHPETKMVFVVDAKTNQRIYNVAQENITREKGTVYFQPVSGIGDYYVYYMPYTQKGSPYYPTAVYYKPVNTAEQTWLDKIKQGKTITATALELQSVNAFNSFYPMEIIATEKERQTLLATQRTAPYIVFPEDRLHSIRMRYDFPQRWAQKGIQNSFSDVASRGENFAYQLGVYSQKDTLKNVVIAFSDLKDGKGNTLSKNTMECINNKGVNWVGIPETFDVNVPQGQIQPMWCTIAIPENAAAGNYKGTVVVQTSNAPAKTINISLTVRNQQAKNHGTDEPWKQTRLSWLNSTLAAKNEVIAPYTDLKITGNKIDLLGRSVEIGASGFPKQIQTYFTPEMTEIGTMPKNLLVEPIHFHVRKTDGKEIKFSNTAINFTEKSVGTIAWKTINESPEMKMDIGASLEFDGFLDYTVKVVAQQDLSLKDITLHLPIVPENAEYLMGLGYKGGNRQDTVQWKWDVAHKNQDGAWIGTVNAGLQFSLRDEHYSRPLNTNFYLQKPLVLPTSWGNGTKGGIDIYKKGSSVLVNSYSGARDMKKGDTLYYDFRLIITPFHAINTDFQWSARFVHKYLNVDTVKALGATVVNIHQGTPINPYINYPFVKTKEMKTYIDSAHAEGLKVKIYNTVRELSNRAYELPALFSLGHEIFSDGKSGGYSWLQEHLDTGYIAAWYTPEANDAAIINSGMSRWHNYYVEGMNWLTQNIGIDGIYLDDVAFDRTIMKRIKRVLTKDGHPGIIDLHSANQYNKSDGFNNSANLYLELFPYLNRLWFGEYFDYENSTPDFFLTEVSGIPFGLMGEMLQSGGNQWRGLLYGMTSRLLWDDSRDPRPIWKVWDSFGMQGSKMIGYWVKENPVKTDNPDVPATIYKKGKKVLVALASWAPSGVDVHLNIDWQKLGINPSKAKIIAHDMPDFQPAKTFEINDAIMVEPRKGWFLEITE